MPRHLLHISVGFVALLALTASVSAADPPAKAPAPPPVAAPRDDSRRGDDYRQFFKKPETTEEYWLALQYEIEVGRFDLASGLIHSLLAKPPTEEELLALEEKYGMAAFLTLRYVEWSNDAKIRDQAKDDASKFIDLVREAVKKKLNDAKRIQLYVNNLNVGPEEHDFALKELYRSGGQVVPYLIDAWQAAKPEERLPLLDAMRRLGPETLPPLYAALDSNIPDLQLDILDMLRKRGARAVVPFLWRLTEEGQPGAVRRKARRMLADFLDMDESKLPPAKLALTQEAERYYQHKVLFADPKSVPIWRWDAATKKLVFGWPGALVTSDKAEEYYGTRFAKEALVLDPSYAPAQNVLLSLTLDKGAVQAGPPVGKETPAVRELLSTVNPDLITAILERALDDQRPAVILPAVKALGEMEDVRAARPGDHGQSALVRALNYPDRRVQMAAAEALMRIPGEPAGQTAGRIVEIWRRALAADPVGKTAPKVIVGYFSEDVGNKVADSVRKAGYDPIQVRTGRDVLKRLNEAADVDLVLIDEALPDPGLASLLSQLRGDLNYGRVPVVLTVDKEREDAVRHYAEHAPNVTVLPASLTLAAGELKTFLQHRLDEGGQPLSEAELKEAAEKAIHHLAELSRGQPAGADVRPTAETVYAALRSAGLSPEGQIDAIHVVGRFAGGRPQIELADVVLDDKRTPKVRAVATAELIRHIQEHSLTLTGVQIDSLAALYGKGGDPELKSQLALLMGGMRPDARVTGQRLLNYQPPPPAAAPAPAKEPPPPPKDAPPKDAPPKDAPPKDAPPKVK
jgi:CheY-like chemotaxis protein